MSFNTSTHACIFPGQGSQVVGMGKDLADNFSDARRVFEEVDDALHQNLSTLIFEGPEETLTMTANTQPALMAVSLAVVKVIEAESGRALSDLCSLVAGHSLGEYSALAAAGALTITDTAKLLRIRGEAMQEAVPAGQGGMAALIGADFETAKTIAAAVTNGGTCQAANDNGGGQVVLSGSMAAIDQAIKVAADHGVRKAVKLPVSAPFHSSLMEPAARRMEEALAGASIQAPSVPIIANVTAQETVDPNEIRKLLVQQVTGTVRWRETVLAFHEKSIEHVSELGSGKVLAGLVKRIDKAFETRSVQHSDDIKDFLALL